MLSEPDRLRLLEPPAGPVRVVIDTDTYNEIDDQFALVYALRSRERLAVEAIYAAPFHNQRSSGPADGMRKSLAEIERVLARLGGHAELPLLEGAADWLPTPLRPVASPAVDDLIARARAPHDTPLYVIAIGAITNVASALLADPGIAERIVVVWLGGHPHNWHHTREFNLKQDVAAAQVVFDCGVPLMHVPCINVAEHLRTTQAEMERFVRGAGAIGDYLYEIYSAYYDDHFARSKELWDLAAVAWLVNPGWFDSVLVPSPILNADLTWGSGEGRHSIRVLRSLKRDAIFADLFRKLEQPG
jgi:purine nucleosidase